MEQVTAVTTATDAAPSWTAGQLEELGRCAECGFHPPTQGHHDDCRRAESVERGYGSKTAAIDEINRQLSTATLNAADSADPTT